MFTQYHLTNGCGCPIIVLVGWYNARLGHLRLQSGKEFHMPRGNVGSRRGKAPRGARKGALPSPHRAGSAKPSRQKVTRRRRKLGR